MDPKLLERLYPLLRRSINYYRHIIFRPQPGGTLTRAAASLDTAYGRTSIRWQRGKDAINIEAEVPPGTRATLHPPVASDPVILAPGNHTFEFELAAADHRDAAPLQPTHR